MKRFKLLPKLAEVVLVIPHNNADLEKLFSIMRKNKTVERSTVKLDLKLSSILPMKSMYPESETPCFQFKPTKELLESSKKATRLYNTKNQW